MQEPNVNINPNQAKSEIEHPLPPLFDLADKVKSGDEIKVTVKDVALKYVKRALINRILPKEKIVILKMGQKARKYKLYIPIVIENEVYVCMVSDPKRKLVMFVHIGPYGKLEEMIRKTKSGLEVA